MKTFNEALERYEAERDAHEERSRRWRYDDEPDMEELMSEAEYLEDR